MPPRLRATARPATTPAELWMACRREHRRCGRTAPVRRIARRPTPDWRRQASSPAASPCRAAQGREYKAEAGTCCWDSRGVGGEGTVVQICILIRDRRGDTVFADFLLN